MKTASLLILLFSSICVDAQIYKDSNNPIDERVSDLMKHMTLEDKIGQMIVADYAPVSKNMSDIVTYRIGNILFGSDSDRKSVV